MRRSSAALLSSRSATIVTKPSRRFWSGVRVAYRGCHAVASFLREAARSAKASERQFKNSTGLRSRKTSMGLCSLRASARAPTLCKRLCRSFALERIASSIADQDFSCSGVSCNAALTIAIRASVKVFKSLTVAPRDVGSAEVGVGIAERKSHDRPRGCSSTSRHYF